MISIRDPLEYTYQNYQKQNAKGEYIQNTAFNKIARIYDETRMLPPEIMSKLISTISQYIQKKDSIADIGIGTGRFTKPLFDMGFNVVGLDLSIFMIKNAQEKGLKNLVVGDVTKLPFQNRSFDFVILASVLKHVANWTSASIEVSKIAKKNVMAIIENHTGLRIRELYLRERNRTGYALNRFESGEEGLCDIAQPKHNHFITTYTTIQFADMEIDLYANRYFGTTWGVPENIHQGIINKIKETFSGKAFMVDHSIRLAIWEPADLREGIEKYKMMSNNLI